ncbi:MAG TPA: hypothetical protein VKH81_01690 [Candidatus Angelobacter sp.]|nr:hypothetical protein [Candidatus Angelobacter sp.]
MRFSLEQPAKRDNKGPAEFALFAMEWLPDELWVISIVVGLVFGFVWLIGILFRSFFGE